MKFVDIHTHKSQIFSDECAVGNLEFDHAENALFANGKGLFSLGIHPCSVDKIEIGWFEKLKTLCKDKRIVLIGECGLDKNSSISLRHQIEVFEKHIFLSEELKKPLIIHCVGCFNELFEIRKQQNLFQKWIIHGFRGKPQLAKQILNAGCDISFGEKFNAESVKQVPSERLFIETDESEISVKDIYKQIALLRGCKSKDMSAGIAIIRSRH